MSGRLKDLHLLSVPGHEGHVVTRVDISGGTVTFHGVGVGWDEWRDYLNACAAAERIEDEPVIDFAEWSETWNVDDDRLADMIEP